MLHKKTREKNTFQDVSHYALAVSGNIHKVLNFDYQIWYRSTPIWLTRIVTREDELVKSQISYDEYAENEHDIFM